MPVATLTPDTLAPFLREVRFSYDEEYGWVAEVPGYEDLLCTAGRTPEEALAELVTLIEAELREEEEEGETESLQPVGFSLDPGLPSPFGIPWRWILLPAIVLTLLLLTLVVRSQPAAPVPTPPASPTRWSAPAPAPPPLLLTPYPGSSRELERELELERRLRELERRQDLCADPDLPPHLRDRCR